MGRPYRSDPEGNERVIAASFWIDRLRGPIVEASTGPIIGSSRQAGPRQSLVTMAITRGLPRPAPT